MSPSADYQLNIETVKVTDLPSEATLLAQGRAILESTYDWTQGKKYEMVQTYSRPSTWSDSAGWHCRVSVHPAEEATFDELRKVLAVNKGQNEMKYVDEVKKATLVKQISPTQAIWSMYYNFGVLGVYPRVFTVLQTTQTIESSPRSCMIISIPLDLSPDHALAQLEEDGVKARYVSVEEFRELDGDKVEWRVATASRAEGYIPQFLTERMIPGGIAGDVPGLLKYIQTTRQSVNGKA